MNYRTRLVALCVLALDVGAAGRLAAEEPVRVDGKTVAEWIEVFRTNKDVYARREAASALGEFGPAAAEAVPELAKPLHSGDGLLALHAASALARIGGPGHDELLKALRNEDSSIRLATAQGIRCAKFVLLPILQALVERVRTESETDLYGPAIRENAAQALGAQHAIDELNQLLTDESPTVRRHALSGFWEYNGAPQDARDAIMRATKDPDETVRARALKMLSQLEEPSVQDLLRAMSDSSAEVRASAAAGLASAVSEAEEVIPVLCNALLDPDGRVRKRAAESLTRFGASEDAVCALESALGDPDAGPPASAYLARCEGGIAMLLVAVRSEDTATRINAVKGLGAVWPAQEVVVSPLIDALRDPDIALKRAAVSALMEQKRFAVPQLRPLLKDKDPATRALSAEALGNMGEWAAPAIPEITAALDDADALVRKSACLALRRLGTEARSAIPALIRALADSDGAVRVNAIWALERLGAEGPELTAALQGLASDEDKDVRESAQRLLDRLKAK